MDHYHLKWGNLLSHIIVAVVLVETAHISIAATAVELSKPIHDPHLEQPMAVERTAQISATVESPQCYENIGCPHKDPISEEQIGNFSCENLWLIRNTIF